MKFWNRIVIALFVVVSASQGGEAPGELSAAARAAMESLKALPESERRAVLEQFGGESPNASSKLQTKLDALPAKENGEEAETAGEKKPSEPEKWSMHYQGTVISQLHDTFNSPYDNAMTSLQAKEGGKARTSATGTIFFGRRLWEGGEVYFNPEFSGGEGFSGVTGIAGFPNGDITRVGSQRPTPYVARAFMRQTFDLGGEREDVEGAANQLAGPRPENRLVLTFGKIAVTDMFDSNSYSHDPRIQFMNWALMDNGAWDYPADTRGYMPGVVAEYIRKGWALRYGAVMVPSSANGAKYDFNVAQALSHNLEFEKSYKLCEREGTARILAYYNHARMGDYRQSVRDALNAGTIPDVTATRAYRAKYGFGVNLEQKISDDLGAFSRAGWNDGQSETWMFTEIDRTISLGLSLSGKRWKRDDDQIGLAGVVNGISGAHKSYLEHGGRGYLIGDGRLNYATEKIIESYYKVAMSKSLFLTLDYQFVHAPAYNKDRGPVNIGGVRFHVEF